uniref:hypothetical protein n=1 Tax=Acinetobacter nosocomialis TaxID=106654 RepID=UPI002091B289
MSVIRSLNPRQSVLSTVLAITVMVAGAIGAAAQVPVTDQRVQNTTNQQLSELQKQLQQLQQISRTVQQLQQATGMQGSGAGSGGLGNIMGMVSQGLGAISGQGGLSALGGMNLN